jgi:N-hydroxyarylamine O-acetyltransferase
MLKAVASVRAVSGESYDLDGYFARIGYAGARTATYGVLAALLERHALTIPFENIDVLLGRPIGLDPPSLQAKLVRGGRGGYCFEHNALLAGILERLGFDVSVHVGRGRWRVPDGVTLPRTHMVLTIALGGERYLVDGGYGGVGLTAPLRLECADAQPSLFEEQRIVTSTEGRLVQARIAGEWRDLYTFADERVPHVDVEVANWYTSTHPESRFRQNLIVTCATREARHVLYNRELTTYGRGSKETTSVDDPDALLEVLSSYFGLSFPPGARFGESGAAWASGGP